MKKDTIALESQFFYRKEKLKREILRLESQLFHQIPNWDRIHEELDELEKLGVEIGSTYLASKCKSIRRVIASEEKNLRYNTFPFSKVFASLSKMEYSPSSELRSKVLERNTLRNKTSLQNRVNFLSYQFDRVSFLLPLHSYTIKRNVPTKKHWAKLGSEKIQLFPNSSFSDTISPTANLILQTRKNEKLGFYFDILENSISFSPVAFKKLLIPSKPNHPFLQGQLRYRGRIYHVLK